MKIKNIYWERVNVHFVFENDLDSNIYLVKKDNKIKLSSMKNEIVINVTNIDGTMLDKGSYYLEYNNEKVLLDTSILPILQDKSRIFKYRSGKCTYLVDFDINDDLELIINTNFMVENHKYKKFYSLNEGKNIKEKAVIFFKKIYLFLLNMLYIIFRIFKFSKNKVLFLTENSNTLTGNLKYLYDALESKKTVYAIDNFSGKNKRVFNRVRNSFKQIYFIAHADIIFIDNYTPNLTLIKLSKKTKVIQLWHAGVGFKSVGYARFGLSASPHPYVSCHRNYYRAIVDNKDLINVYKEVFGVKDEVLDPLGMPRLNNYLNKNRIDEVINKLYEYNNDLKTKKVILFSPTYRGMGSGDAYYDYSKINLDDIYSYCVNNDALFIIKMHPFIQDKIKIKDEYKKVILDYSTFDINDLIYITDIMITDYSSCAYEYSLFNRPLIFYRYDKYLYEYLRPIHTSDAFTDKIVEVLDFNSLMKELNNIKVNPLDRFNNISDYKTDSVNKIIDKYIKR